MKVQDLSKVYKPNPKSKVIALDKTTFGMHENECFALLGVNGAGKSTCFKILTSEIQKSSGKVQILGLEIES